MTKQDSFSRVIGACGGGFALAFLSIIATVSANWAGWKATIVWFICLFAGGLLGYRFPRLGYGAAYATVSFISLMLSITIGRNFAEQALVFLIFTIVQIYLYTARRMMSKRFTRKR